MSAPDHTVQARLTPPGAGPGSETPRRAGRLPRRRRPGLILLGVGLLLGAVGGNVAVITSLDQRVPVLVAARDVPWGARLTPADVRPVPMAPGNLAAIVPAGQENQILGEVATVALPVGSVLSPRQLAPQVVPGAGQRLIGLHVGAGRYPAARGLRPGDGIQVLPIATSSSSTGQGESGAAAAQNGPGFAGRVVATTPPDAGGAIAVDVLVTSDAADQAATAAAGDVVVLLLGPS